ncbi:ASCH domain-containing protein [Achromobacter ruhlandii]|uniref:ASCH domain-containing protein n=1 Tax=Achromobacter ruhlandii TaxID=72557 RepID=UPI0022B92D99|nr:ASCH domain-containing protein [Achromobacter ruhlandii]MCZ8434542.1 ASCH domain-containing protein [Achromobacter ruhlandii]MDC6153635.1 ASCH domain-containing protein [Achromobacter ruhlandii]MDD7983078.1 ASCH domain-containing protein [Achromobacter ruhlandii]
MRDLHLALKGEYFDAIKAGTKAEEYRMVCPFWAMRIEGREFQRVILTRGYPRRTDWSRRLELPWRGYTVKTITHPHFGNVPIEVYAIRVTADTDKKEM